MSTRVIVAEDDAVTRLMVTRTLERAGYPVIGVADGEAAWQAIERDRPRLAIFDWMMPGLDGAALCRRIRETPEAEGMYAILLTSKSGADDVIAGLDAGADDYLVKPFDPQELLARVRAGERVLALQQQLTERVAQLQTAMAAVKQLAGLVPICSYCKRIRSDDDYWHQIDSYLAHTIDARFTHGVCPSCLDKTLAEA